MPLNEHFDLYNMEDTEEVRNFLTGTVRVGEVKKIYDKEHRVRVLFHDLQLNGQKVLSWKLPVVVPSSWKDMAYWLPCIGDYVLCLFLPFGREQGFVLGGYYADPEPRPVIDRNKFHMRWEDDTWIEYDKDIHEFNVRHRSGAFIQIDGSGGIWLVPAGGQATHICNGVEGCKSPPVREIYVPPEAEEEQSSGGG